MAANPHAFEEQKPQVTVKPLVESALGSLVPKSCSSLDWKES